MLPSEKKAETGAGQRMPQGKEGIFEVQEQDKQWLWTLDAGKNNGESMDRERVPTNDQPNERHQEGLKTKLSHHEIQKGRTIGTDHGTNNGKGKVPRIGHNHKHTSQRYSNYYAILYTC